MAMPCRWPPDIPPTGVVKDRSFTDIPFARATGDTGGQEPAEFIGAALADFNHDGFTDIAEGTIYALLNRIEQRGYVDVAKVASEKGPPRKVYSLNAAGAEALDTFWRSWSFLSERLEQLRHEGK